MAGDWIKMRGNLWDDPRVARLCDITDQSEAAVVGALYWLWATADQHTEDGILPELTLRAIDRKTGIAGFAQALCEIGWLADLPGGVCITRFEEHNGSSAKRRSLDAQRKASVRKESASDADKPETEPGQIAPVCGAREEKRREEEEKDITQPIGCVTGAKRASNTRGARLPKEWVLPKTWGEWALAEYRHWRPDTVRAVASGFADHYHAKAGKDACKVEWEATWRNWCRSEITQRTHPPPNLQTETAYQRSQREKVQAHMPAIAARPPGSPVAQNAMEYFDAQIALSR